MQIVYLLKENEPIEKVAKINNIPISDITTSSNKILSYHYAILLNGSPDFQVVINYEPNSIYQIKENDTLENLQALGYEVCPNKIEVGDYVLLKKIDGKKHIVKPLEKLEDIATQYYITKEYLKERNNLKTEKLFIGQILWI